MPRQLSLFLALLLSAGCTTKQAAENDANDQISHHEKITTPTQVEYFAEDCIEKIDEGVELIKVTKEWAEEKGLMAIYENDPGFAKWFVVFHDIPDTPPYSLEQKRLLQANRDYYYPCLGTTPEDTITVPTGMMVSVRGYLPGEKVTIRLSSKNAHREIVFYPRPLIMKRSGKLLVKAELRCAQPGHTFYHLYFIGMGEEEKYKFMSRSGQEFGSSNLQGPIETFYMPEVAGRGSGFATVTLQFQDRTRYSMKLPWGYEFLDYMAGKR